MTYVPRAGFMLCPECKGQKKTCMMCSGLGEVAVGSTPVRMVPRFSRMPREAPAPEPPAAISGAQSSDSTGKT